MQTFSFSCRLTSLSRSSGFNLLLCQFPAMTDWCTHSLINSSLPKLQLLNCLPERRSTKYFAFKFTFRNWNYSTLFIEILHKFSWRLALIGVTVYICILFWNILIYRNIWEKLIGNCKCEPLDPYWFVISYQVLNQIN